MVVDTPACEEIEDARLALRHGTEATCGLADAVGRVLQRYTHEELATLFTLGPAWTWETDAAHRYSFISPAMEPATGVLVADLIGRTRRDCFFVNGSLAPEVLRHFDDLEQHRAFSDFVFEARDRTGRQSWICTSGVPRFDHSGTFTGYLGISRALSDSAFVQSGLKNATDRIQRMETLLGEVFESIPVGIAIFDAQSRFVTCNAHYRDIFSGFADHLIPGTPILKLLEVAWDRGIIANPHEIEAKDRDAARAEWIARRQKQHRQDDYRDVTILSDGRHLQQISKRLPDGNFISVRVDVTDRVRHASELELARATAYAAETQMRSAIEALSTGFALWSHDARMIMCNSKFIDMIGPGVPISDGEVYGDILRRVADAGRIINRDDGFEAWLASDIEALKGKQDLEDTYPICDGRWILRRVTSTSDGLRVDIRTDITELKRSEQRIAEASHAAEDARLRLRVAIDSLSTGFALWDAEDRLVLFNRTLKNMASPFIDFREGETYEAIMRRMVDCGLVVAANESGDPQRWLSEVIGRRQRRQDAEYLYLSQDGRWILQRETMTPTGERVDVRTDITELKASETRIRDALEDAKLAREVVNELKEPIFVKDEALRFVFCNDAFARIHGETPSGFEGKMARDFVSEADACEFEQSERAVLETGEPFATEEDYFDGGEERTRIVRKSLITTEGGKRYVAGYMFDVTALRQRERALELTMRRAESADKAKSDFLANMSHEIRTPMNGVLSMADLLGQGALDERQRMFVDVIRKSGETLLGTINNILDYSKIGAGSMTLDVKPFPLRQALEDVAGLLAAKACERETRIVVCAAPRLPAIVTGDELRIRQILANLIGNAIKATERGEIVICANGEVTNGTLGLDITVSDTGCGIPESQIDRIFDRFTHFEADTGTRQSGTGLGLSIVARLTEMMGGTCTVTSAPGEGSSFRVDLPLACADPRPPAVLVPDALRGRRIIVLDRSEAQRRALVEPLTHWGFDACGVESVDLALALATTTCERGAPPDLLIIGCGGMGANCQQQAARFDARWPFAPVGKLLIAPVNAVTGASTGDLSAMMTGPVRQAELLHHVLACLQAQTGTGPAAVLRKSAAAGVESASTRIDPPAAPQWAGTGHRVDVLVAEDNPVNQLVMAQILDMTGLTYQIVADGALAVDAFRSHKPLLVLMDVNMPRLNGYQATSAIRDMAELGGDRVPIIGVTAHVSDEEREACRRCGMSDHIAKPVSPEMLLGRVAQWLPTGASRRKA
ncbi:MAG: PAS-domain containing protein [Rhizobiaceae bacterium]|jgi:PAS domain S-box-containing protein|nr:PAS-domain containing protein [Rhizobiaceae bacterium]